MVLLMLVSFLRRGAEAQVSAGIFAANRPEAVPSFLIIGTAKGGTTDLFEQLANDDVNAPSSRPDPPITRNFIRKEVGVLLHSFCIQDLLLGKSRYLHYLERLGHPCANTTLTALRDCVNGAGRQELTIDATPTYVTSPLLPHMLSVFSPWSKVIVMLRDPVDRAQSLYNHFLVEEGRWRDRNLDALVDAFVTFVNSTAGMPETLVRLAACKDIFCEADGWSDLVGLGLLDYAETALFGGGLYRYILAPWRLHYFRPHRVMLIDAHTYFADRTAVMDQVVRFLYGRPLTPVERHAATHGKAVCVKRHKTTVPSVEKGTLGRTEARRLTEDGETPAWALSPAHHRLLSSFYDMHVKEGLVQAVQEMRQEGAWVVGFDAPPWVNGPAAGGGASGLDERSGGATNAAAWERAETAGQGAGAGAGAVLSAAAVGSEGGQAAEGGGAHALNGAGGFGSGQTGTGAGGAQVLNGNPVAGTHIFNDGPEQHPQQHQMVNDGQRQHQQKHQQRLHAGEGGSGQQQVKRVSIFNDP